MNEDINLKIKRLAEEMKRQQAEEDWQKVTAKKGKKVIAETSAKATSTEVKPSTEGKIASTGEASLQANKVASTEVRTRQSLGATTQRKVPLKPFATTVVRDWYNNNLKIQDEETYNTINGCFRAIQSNGLKATNYWLMQAEQIIIRQRQ